MSGLKGKIQLGRAGWELFPSEHCVRESREKVVQWIGSVQRMIGVVGE